MGVHTATQKDCKTLSHVSKFSQAYSIVTWNLSQTQICGRVWCVFRGGCSAHHKHAALFLSCTITPGVTTMSYPDHKPGLKEDKERWSQIILENRSIDIRPFNGTAKNMHVSSLLVDWSTLFFIDQKSQFYHPLFTLMWFKTSLIFILRNSKEDI